MINSLIVIGDVREVVAVVVVVVDVAIPKMSDSPWSTLLV